MTFLESVPSSGESKIDEYVRRIQEGEDRNAIVQGLPEKWVDAINKKLGTSLSTNGDISEEQRLQQLSKRFDLPHENDKGELSLLSIEERKKLRGWVASYELAKIAKAQGVDLSTLSREEYADFAIKQFLAIDDTQLRMATWERMATSAEDVIARKKENVVRIQPEIEENFRKFSYEMITKAREQDRFMYPNIRVRQGTGESNSWLFFGINESTQEGDKETHKAYISFKDINMLTPEKFKTLMIALRDAGYNGDIKIFQDLENQGILLNDQIVMHGRTEQDAIKALATAEVLFGGELGQKGIGKDEVINGKNTSYSEILAEKISSTIK